jgi:DNA-binding response OmpR family regulator/DNA-binding CsgD family transcriptional regulator
VTNSSLKRSVVLVVDDHPDTLQFLIDALEDAGITVMVATDGKSALKQVSHLLPDLILLDAIMPGLDGFETCRALKSGPATDVPVIFMTGLDDTEHIVKGLEAGGIDYLTKPIAPDELLARMRVHLGNARKAQGVRNALDMSGRTMLAADIQGNIRWATPQAQRILESLAGKNPAPAEFKSDMQDTIPPAGTELPAQVRAWLSRCALMTSATVNESIVVAMHNIKIRFHLLSRVAEDEILLVIQQAESEKTERAGANKLQSRFGLTSREAEVLYWLSCGKSNRDIADILGISYRTVDKHLEHLFAKIGVESRSSAIATSVRTLSE